MTETAQCLFCGKTFDVTRKGKKYCTKKCCTDAANKEILRRYHENKNIDKTKRKCVDCEAYLSQYNNDKICSLCSIRRKDRERMKLLEQLGFFSYTEE